MLCANTLSHNDLTLIQFNSPEIRVGKVFSKVYKMLVFFRKQ